VTSTIFNMPSIRRDTSAPEPDLADLLGVLRTSASTVDSLCRDSQALGGDDLEMVLTEVSHCLHRALIALDGDGDRPRQISRAPRRPPVFSSAYHERARAVGRLVGDRFERARAAIGSVLPASRPLRWRGERGRRNRVETTDSPVVEVWS
jgi:hypothetical protein